MKRIKSNIEIRYSDKILKPALKYMNIYTPTPPTTSTEIEIEKGVRLITRS